MVVVAHDMRHEGEEPDDDVGERVDEECVELAESSLVV